VQHTGQRDIGAKLAASMQKTLVLEAREACPDAEPAQVDSPDVVPGTKRSTGARFGTQSNARNGRGVGIPTDLDFVSRLAYRNETLMCNAIAG
jgi:hypothetical protein